MDQQPPPHEQAPPPQWTTPPQQPTQYGWGGNGSDPARPRSNVTFADFLMFRFMITPAVIVVIYIVGFVGITLAALATVSDSVLLGAALFLFGQLYLRVILEFIVVLFRLHSSVQSIDRKTLEPPRR